MSEHWRTTLNNWLQSRYGTTVHLTWECTYSGPAHAVYWTAVAYFNDIEYGRAGGSSRGAAAEEAARQAVVALRGY